MVVGSHGKGQKTQRIPVNDCFLKALIRYREFYRLPKLPQPGEENGLFMNSAEQNRQR